MPERYGRCIQNLNRKLEKNRPLGQRPASSLCEDDIDQWDCVKGKEFLA
jgi:hypothetical protein